MEAKELLDLKVDELKARVQQWREELFRARFKARTSEAKDTSVPRKLRRDIARALTVLTQKAKGVTAAPSDKIESTPVTEKKEKAPAKSKAKTKRNEV